MKYDVIIGLEIHVEINTKSKMFCSCSGQNFNSTPNSNVCPICLGHPGTLPLLNKEALNKALLLSLALDCQINKTSKFDRKNYFYPDLPKSYQISQYDLPIGYKGILEVNKQKIKIGRIHLEEDTAKLTHPKGKNYSLVDFNRSGLPLLEMVTYPSIRDANTAKIFCKRFQQILRYLDISSANMEKGEMRCEANVSLQNKKSWYENEKGEIKALKKKQLNNKVELKNINSFKSLEKAINYEIKRQSQALDKNHEILAETRGYDEKKQKSFRQRTKESGADYRYFPEPDIAPIKISSEKMENIKKQIIELPHNKKKRFIEEYKLSPDMAEILINNKDIADWMEMIISELREWISSIGESWENQNLKLSKLSANYLTSHLFKLLKKDEKNIKDIKISSENFAELISLIYKEKINPNSAQKILKIMYETGKDPSNIMEEHNLEQKDDSDPKKLESIAKEIMNKYPKQLKEYRKGKDALSKFFIGKIMAGTKGQYKAKKIIEIIKKEKKKKAFTLIEIIVTVSIILVILIIGVISFNITRENTRNANRVNDIKQIQLALEMYRDDSGSYPDSLNFGSSLNNPDYSDIVYLGEIPSNPKPRSDGDCPGEEYKYESDGDFYYLEFCLGKKTGEISAGVNCAKIEGIEPGACPE
jgi:aspartyl-tRNA(Asn)/glutamyl-tRNA(Gln) amidotransferase subunit B